MNIGIPKTTEAGEHRVSLTPDVVARLTKDGYEVVVQSGAGTAAGFVDDAYVASGASIVDAARAWSADVVVAIEYPSAEGLSSLKSGAVLLGLLQPLDQPARLTALAATGVTSIAFEVVPRTTRAQSMDILSSQATVAGYQAVLMAADKLDKFFPMLTTAAGTIAPSKVLILGAGVAGLMSIATARRLGAIVSAFDVRAEAAEQVESLGAKFVSVDMEQQDSSATGGYAKEVAEDTQAKILAGLAKPVSEADVVISTAQIPGRPAPLLITRQMIESMRPGALVIDLAAPTGGNCELTEAGKTVVHSNVSIVGPTNLPSMAAGDASRMYGRNALALMKLFLSEDGVNVDFADDIIEGSVVTHGGNVVHPRVKALLDGGGN
ncbi:MAG: Re/Si-specific NAD(P)(+) transhydrogenase subunit alpha [Acidimicrobiia bacterium]|nr:Re/Si-specific NAD(P)(+) transhydrogenase subunit alpha [Acidimicrobiia bacterium]